MDAEATKPLEKITEPPVAVADPLFKKEHTDSRYANVKKFSKFIWAIVLDNPKQLILTLILSLLSTAAQIGLAIYVFKLIQAGGGEMTLFSVELSGKKLWIIPVAMALAAAVIPYLADRYIIAQTVVFFKKSIRDIADALGATHQRYKLFVWAKNNSMITRLMSSDARYASLAFAGLLRLVFPITIALTSFIALFFLNFKWTVGLIVLMIPFLIWQLNVVISGTGLNRELRRAGVAHGQAAAKYVGALSTHFTSNRRGDTLAEAANNLITDDFPNAYGERLKLGISTRLVGDFAIVGLILLICGLVISGNFTLETFSNIFVYAVVVRFAMANLSRTVTGTISIISQVPFYENYVAAQIVLKEHSDDPEDTSERPEQVEPPYDLINPNQVQVVFSSIPLDWIFVFKFLAKRSNFAFAMRSVGQALLASGGYRNFSSDFIQELQIAPLENEAKFSEVFPYSAHRWTDFNLATSHSERLDEAWAEVPRPIKFLCSLNFAQRKRRGGSFVFINGADYLGLTVIEKEWVRDIFPGNHIVIVFSRSFREKLVADVSGYFLMTSDGTLYHAGDAKGFDKAVKGADRLFKYEKQAARNAIDIADEPFSDI